MRTRETAVVQVGCVLVKHDWYGVIFLQEFRSQGRYVLLGNLESGPAKPEKLDATVCKASQACDQTSGRCFQLEFIMIEIVDGYWQSV